MSRVITFSVFAMAAMVTTTSVGQETSASKPERIKVMVLGTFHFNQLDNKKEMLTPKRQKEIATVLKRLKEFKPDKIFVERNPEFEYANKMDERYQKYLAGKYELPANEIFQLGYRLAKELGHKRIYQADHPGLYGAFNQKVRRYARQNDQMRILDGKTAGTTLGLYRTEKDVDDFKNKTLTDYLLYLNSERYVRADHGWYVTTLPRVGDTDPPKSRDDRKDYDNEYFIGAKMLADWYRRNIMIYAKVLKQLSYKEKRILVIFGAGHNSTLKHLFASNPHLEVVEVADWLGKKKDKSEAKE